jgi:tetratricopeptide (TPR) repeat protein
MSTTLNLTDSLLAMGRELHEQGRARDARLLFERLVKFRDLGNEVAEEAHARLAELLLAVKEYKKARRHLTILMCLRPSSAQYCYRYAVATHRDPKGDPHRASRYYRQAVDMDPTHPRWWSNYGKLLIRLGRTTEAVTHLRRAHELDADDPVVISRLVEALCLDDRADEARTLLRVARFKHPRDGRFRKLWNDFQFHQAAAEQRMIEIDEPVLLPFVRRAAIQASDVPTGTILRFDAGQDTPALPHRLRRSIRRDA